MSDDIVTKELKKPCLCCLEIGTWLSGCKCEIDNAITPHDLRKNHTHYYHMTKGKENDDE